MNAVEQKRNAKQFVERWLKEPGNEEQQSRSFWIQLAEEVLGIPNATHVFEFERPVGAQNRRIDVFYEDMKILIEQKSRGVSLDEAKERSKTAGLETPYQQACWYANHLPFSVRPRWIITCNFDEIRIYDQEREDLGNYEVINLTDLPDEYWRLSFFTDKSNSRIEKEKQLSVQAGEIVGKLYDQLSRQYLSIKEDKHEQFSLNVLIVRLVFLLYAEDAELLQERDAFLNYLRKRDPEQIRVALIELFNVLDTPVDERDPYLSDELKAFPYINGGLYSKDVKITIPQFTENIKVDLLLNASQEFDWSEISPTIFGAVFESTLNPETRRAGGMHYTSVENIHKVIDPLFLNDLKEELKKLEGTKGDSLKERRTKFRAFQDKLSKINIFDPACGSGNFLTESYLSLRKLENRAIENIQGNQSSFDIENANSIIKVSISQFYGIEINDFAVSVAKTALWIAEEQMMEATQEIVYAPFEYLPLKSNSNIHEGNALRVNWDEVLPAEKCTYICGNPPFYGARNQNEKQKQDVLNVWKDSEMNQIGSPGLTDYVASWFFLACLYMQNNKDIRAAFVSTNSIVQGEQVEFVWHNLQRLFKVSIYFAYKTFVWSNEALDQAHVHCVIIGFSLKDISPKLLFDADGSESTAAHINAYLMDAPDVYLKRLKKSLCGMPQMSNGNRAYDGNNLVMDSNDAGALLRKYPSAKEFVKPYFMGADLVRNEPRYVLWLVNIPSEKYEHIPEITNRIEAVRQMRLCSKNKATLKAAATPQLFQTVCQPDIRYLAFPRVSSSRRKYLPITFLESDVICGDKLIIVPGADLYLFGILESTFHKVWTWFFAGRLKSDISYSSSVYNAFPWPNVTESSKSTVKQHAQTVLDKRNMHPNKSLAELYDPDKMPDDLLAAHKALDKAVEDAYGVDFNGDEEKIVAHLFNLYAQMTEGK